MAYGYAITQPEVTEEDEQLTMSHDYNVLMDILRFDIMQYPPETFDQLMQFLNEYATEEELRDVMRVGIETYTPEGEHWFTLRVVRLW